MNGRNVDTKTPQQVVLPIIALIEARDKEAKHYRKMLYEMTSLTDWQQAGYDPAEYAALVEEFEGKPDHA